MRLPLRDETSTSGKALEEISDHDVAVIGFSVRFPGDATSPEKLWEIIEEGRSVMTEVPADRFNINGFYHPDSARNDTINCRGGHFLSEDVAAFDAPFFSMNPSEVQNMDPQQRGLLETSYRAFENAGLPMESVAGSNTSVYVGALGINYSRRFEFDEEVQATYKANGNSGAILANRLSWFYDLLGPSMTIETACSGSMVSLHLACQSLRSKESNMSLVCGANLYLEPLSDAISLSALKFISPDSICHSFDERGNGYAKGEGFGVVVLKRVKDAVADGDTIRAIIRGTTTNQDGHTPSISQPSQEAQERLIREAYRSGGIDFNETRYFEAHGPGTLLGDPLEAAAVKNIFGKHRTSQDRLYIGSVKANIGHLEATAGLASVIKVILCLEKGIIPPIAGFQNLNPRIESKEWNLEFPKEAVSWLTDGLRRASVNAFGYGGSNAHVILDDAYNYLRERGIEAYHVTAKLPMTPKRLLSTTQDSHINGGEKEYHNEVNGHGSDVGGAVENVNGQITSGDEHSNEPSFLFVLSAADSGGLKRLGAVHEEYLRAFNGKKTAAAVEFLHDFAFTLSDKRSVHPWKSCVLAHSREDLIGEMQRIPNPVRSSVAPKLVFVFTGQGAQWARMGVDLFLFPAFRESMEEADTHMKQLGSTWSLIEELQNSEPSSRIDDPELAQPLCTALQVALVELLASWGIIPSAIVGHSSGEIAAAFSVGSISRKAAWSISYYRGALASRIARSTSSNTLGMMVVALSEKELHPHLEDIENLHGSRSLSIGCFNSNKNSTISGLEIAIDALKTVLDDRAIFSRKLKIPVAYHSPHMQIIADEYLDFLRAVDMSPTRSQTTLSSEPLFVSSVTGIPIASQELSCPEYWVKNLISPVRFSEAIANLISTMDMDQSALQTTKILVEIGPHAAMQRAIQDTVKNQTYTSAMRRDVPALSSLKHLAGQLWMHGFPVRVDRVNHHEYRVPKLLTDVPEYPFNHSNTYWLESRLWKNYRTRENIRHELRGIPSTDWNPFEPKFRFTIRLSDLPWLTDHQLNGTTLYPGAGICIMAFEAARFLNKPDRKVKGYRLQNVAVYTALPVPDTPKGVESQIFLRNQDNHRTTGYNSIECREFRICFFSDDEWREVCAGSITTEYEDEVPDEIYAYDEKAIFQEECSERFRNALARCTATSTPETFYECGRATGYGFGPTFNTLHDIAYDPNGDQATATVYPDEWKSKVPEINRSVQPHLIHPSTLDGVFQVTAAATTKGGTISGGPLQAPTQFRDFWISHDLLSRTPSTKLHILAETTRKAIRETESSVLALISDTGKPALVINGYQTTTVSHLGYVPSERRDIFYQLDWQPDVDLLSRSQIEKYCLEKEPMPVEWEPAKEVVILFYMGKMLKELDTPETLQSLPVHFQKYADWVRNRFKEFGDSNPLLQSPWKETLANESHRAKFFDDFKRSGNVNCAIHSFVKHLTPIMRGETDPLDLLFNQGLANDLYADSIFVVSAKRMAAFVGLLAHKNANMDVLELGAGTGSGTAPILGALGGKQNEIGKASFQSYTFTDISPSFFEKAKVRFADYLDRMKFQTLDVEQCPFKQGFEAGKYDLIVAATMIHATECVADVLARARSLLKPVGHLVIMEPTNKQDVVVNGIWGTLPGWWRSKEADRSSSPLYYQEEWNHYLKNAGFTGCDAAVTDFPDFGHHTLSMIVSRAVPSNISPAPDRFPKSLLIVAKTDLQHNVAQAISSLASSQYEDCVVRIATPESFDPDQDFSFDFCLSLLEYESQFLADVDEAKFANLKRLMGASLKALWVTTGASQEASIPENAMSSGLSRALMLEHEGTHISNLDIEIQGDLLQTANIITSIVEQSFGASNINDQESDYQVSKGTVLIPRAVEAPEINEFSHLRTANLPIEQRLIQRNPTEPLELQLSPGQLDTMRFVKDVRVCTPLADDEVEVEVQATPINFKDVMVALGQVSDLYIGYEYAGIVRRVGAGIRDFAPNDRVTGLASGAFQTYVRSKSHALITIPEDMPFVEALPCVWLTALYGINHLGRLKAGESVLIHAAAGAVGQAAIQLAQLIGADIFVTVSSVAKKQLLQKLYNIPENRFFSSRRTAFGRQIKRATGGRGVDCVINSLSGELLVESWKCIQPLGRFIEIGKRDMETFQKLPMHQFLQNVTFASLDLQTVYENHPTVMKQLMQEMKELIFAKKLNAPQPLTIFSPAEFEQAFRYLQTGKHMGKAVVDWSIQVPIPVINTVEPEYYFDAHATYVIAGGLGGIGRSLAKWMPTRGVKHLILLSRSGPTSQSAQQLISDLTGQGVNVATPQCDIGNAESLEAALRQCNQMPPIKGVIQGAMVLKDRPFDLMTYHEWQAVMGPKLTGTWNLHNLLPSDMDFFVILSSLGGMIGVKGQSQYNAAATFQDAFARHRWSQGQKAISIDIGLVTSVGYVAEQMSPTQRSQKWVDGGFEVLREEELHCVVDWACNPSLKIASGWHTQVLSALNSPKSRSDQGQPLLPYMYRPMYRSLRKVKQTGKSNLQQTSSKPDYGAMLLAAKNKVEGGRIVASALSKRLSQSLSVPEEDISSDRPAHSYGVDSLVAIELRFWFANEIKAELSPFNILANISINELSLLAASKSQYLVQKEES